jgi:hypothetical protein
MLFLGTYPVHVGGESLPSSRRSGVIGKAEDGPHLQLVEMRRIDLTRSLSSGLSGLGHKCDFLLSGTFDRFLGVEQGEVLPIAPHRRWVAVVDTVWIA